MAECKNAKDEKEQVVFRRLNYWWSSNECENVVDCSSCISYNMKNVDARKIVILKFLLEGVSLSISQGFQHIVEMGHY